jgi:hypothetical protein
LRQSLDAIPVVTQCREQKLLDIYRRKAGVDGE